MFPESVLKRLESPEELGPADFAGQFDQRPAPASGLIFQRSWWQYYDTPPAQFDELLISVDAAFKGLQSSDYVAMGVWGRIGRHFYLLDLVHARMDYPATKDALRALCARWPTAHTKLIEEKANGAALIAELGREVGGMVPINPTDSKVSRARAIQGHQQAGCLFLPRYARWLETFIEEHANFPMGKNDDLVDMTTQAILHWLRQDSRAWWLQ
jgi:predicted phage terminase large subunit-like protein